jgi:hypothetical protein
MIDVSFRQKEAIGEDGNIQIIILIQHNLTFIL